MLYKSWDSKFFLLMGNQRVKSSGVLVKWDCISCGYFYRLSLYPVGFTQKHFSCPSLSESCAQSWIDTCMCWLKISHAHLSLYIIPYQTGPCKMLWFNLVGNISSFNELMNKLLSQHVQVGKSCLGGDTKKTRIPKLLVTKHEMLPCGAC